jgi:Peptidase family M28
MSRLRSLSGVLASAVVAALVGFLLSGSPARGDAATPLAHPAKITKWWRPPADVRAMLSQISTANLQQADSTLVGFGTRHTASSQTDPVRGIGAAAQWIFGQLQQIAATSGSSMTVQQQTFVQPVSSNIPVPTTITNIIATLQGTDSTASDRIYVVGAHYDDRVTDVLDFTSDAPGADEDGSGVAAMLELARVMASHPAKATIVFAAFAGEEQGLYGSAFSARQLAAAGAKVQACLNMDTIGSPLGDNGVSERHTIDVFAEGVPTAATQNDIAILQAAGGENDGSARQLARYIKETGENGATDMNVNLVWRRDASVRASDQVSFLAQRFPAVRFTEPNENFNHIDQNVQVQNGVQFGDLLQFVDFNYLARVTRVVGSSVAALANSPRAPSNTRMIITPPPGFHGSNDTVLHWDANPESDVVGYEVVLRDSTDPLWTNALQVGNITQDTITVPDPVNTQFGVRAIDSQGHRSPVSYAVPSS